MALSKSKALVLAFTITALNSPTTAKSVEPLKSDYRTFVSSDIVRVPLVIENKDKDRCAALKAEDFRVTEDGEEKSVVDLAPSRLPTLHVLLIDTSESMVAEGRLTGTLRAANGYLNWLFSSNQSVRSSFAQDSAMVATFDDDLILRAPITPLNRPEARAKLIHSLDQVTSGFFTSLTDSLETLIRYLRSQPLRVVIILFSDGADINGSQFHAQVLKTVNTTNNLTIFPIGLSLDARAKSSAFGSPSEHFDFLSDLAEISGGRFFNLWGLKRKSEATIEGRLKNRLDLIQARLDKEYFLSYQTSDLELPVKTSERNVKIDTPSHPCKISGYKPVRFISAPSQSEQFENSLPDPNSAEPGSAEAKVRLLDIIRDSGPLWGEKESRVDSEWRTVLFDVPVISSKLKVRVDHLPAESPEDWLFYAVDRFRQGLGPFLNGKTILAEREDWVSKIYATRSFYEEWLRERMRPDIEADLKNRLPASTPAETINKLVKLRLDAPRKEDLARYMGVWFGDISSRALQFKLEVKMANTVLATPPDQIHEEMRQVVRVYELWPLLLKHLGRPTQVRVRAPLALFYDSKRDLFGFYRIVLPRFNIQYAGRNREAVTVFDPLSSKPFGFLLVNWIMQISYHAGQGGGILQIQDPKLRQAIRDEVYMHWKAESLEHHPILNPQNNEPILDNSRVHMVLAKSDSQEPTTIVLDANMTLVHEDPWLTCLSISTPTPGTNLSALLKATELPACPQE